MQDKVHEFPAATAEQMTPIKFRVPGGTGEVYEAAREMPAAFAEQLARIREPGITSLEQSNRIGELFDMILYPESAAKFAANWKNPDPRVGISATAAGEVFRWLIGEYTGRPSEPVSGSAGPATGTDTSSEGTSVPTEDAGPPTTSGNGSTPSTS